LLMKHVVLYCLLCTWWTVLCVGFGQEGDKPRRLDDELILRNPGLVITGCSDEKHALLTYDDGPSRKWTRALLAQLRRLGVRALFFVLTDSICGECDEETVRMIVRQGHHVGLHGCSHTSLCKMSREEVKRTLRSGKKRLEGIVQKEFPRYNVRYFRPPYGSIDECVLECVREQRMKIVLWNVDTDDWKLENQANVGLKICRMKCDIWLKEDLECQKKRKKEGLIVLGHDTYSSSVCTQGPIRDCIRDMGYSTVGPDECFRDFAG
jgi:peptidoglycan/xylan/chitin deacetylase (PgdA/CDA1 family)